MSLKVPKWQVNEELPPLQRFANPKTREALKERLISGDYRSLTEAGEVNPALKDAIISIIGSRQIESLVEQDTGAEADDEGLLIPKRRAGVELLVSIATRLRNQNNLQFSCCGPLYYCFIGSPRCLAGCHVPCGRYLAQWAFYSAKHGPCVLSEK